MALKYKTIADELRSRIFSGVYPPDSMLPTEYLLCKAFNCSRQTIRAALQCLADEGLIQRRQGSGSRVVNVQETRQNPRRTIAIITTNITDYIFPSVLRKAEAVFSANNCEVMLYATANQVSVERRILQGLLDHKKIDGILVEGTKTAHPNPNLDLYRKIQQKGIPLVFFHGNYSELENTVSVLDDNYNGGRMLVEYLAFKGHTQIAGIFKYDDLQGHQRYAGYIDALRDLGLPMEDRKVFWYNTEFKEVFDAKSEIWEHIISPFLHGCTAVVCYNDQIAKATVEFLLAHHVSIPRQVAVVSFDNSVFSEFGGCRITSLSHEPYNVGQISAEKLVELMNGNSVSSQYVPWVLVEKESS